MIINVSRRPKTAAEYIKSIKATLNNGTLDIDIELTRDLRLGSEVLIIGANGPAPANGQPEDGPDQQLFAILSLNLGDLTKFTFKNVTAPPGDEQWYYYVTWAEIQYWPPPPTTEAIHTLGTYYPSKK